MPRPCMQTDDLRKKIMSVSLASRLLLVSLVLLSTRLRTSEAQSRYAPCDSPIYCFGDLLDAVQRAGIFNDSKEFVDRPLIDDVSNVLDAFSRLPANVSSSKLREFVFNWTIDAGSDIEMWTPGDWVQRPLFIDNIVSKAFQEWALQLNAIWRQLGRQENASVSQFPDHHSLIPVPHPFIAPGGRFREFYYWDSYWIVRGLLICGMSETAKNMILNMVSMIERYGFVPNGGRVYYAHRSHPPLLTQMVDAYLTCTGDVEFLRSVLPSLLTEYEFWIENRTVDYVVDEYVRYGAELDTPRPESYREDLNTATNASDTGFLYSDLASGAESGWDFSSRWLRNDSLSSIRTLRIIPVDLNAVLCQNEATLAKFYRIIGNDTMADLFDNTLLQRQASFDKLFWNESSGLWRDRDIDRMAHLDGFYASSLVPLLWNCTYPNSSSNDRHLSQQKAVLRYLKAEGLLDYIGGIPASLDKTSNQQWDFPNVWAPLQWFPVLAWVNSSEAELREAASSIAATWLNSTYDGWVKYNAMFEKYNCTESGEPGSGGEYSTQTGFGWTNGVVLDFLVLYPNATFNNSSSTSDNSSSMTSPPTEPSSPPTLLPTTTTRPPSSTSLPVPSSTPPPPDTLPQQQSLGWVAAIVLLVISIAVAIPCVFCCMWCYRSGETRYWARVRNEHLIAAGGGGSGTSERGRERRSSPTVYSNEYADDFSDSSWDV